MGFLGNGLRACLLLVGSVVSLPIDIRQTAAVAFTDETMMEQSEFLPPGTMTSLPLLSIPMLRGSETHSSVAQPPASMRSGSDQQVQRIAFHRAALSTARGSTTRIAIGCGLVVLLLVCSFMMCSAESKDSETTTMTAAETSDAFLAMENCDGTWARTYQKADGQYKQGLELLYRCHIVPAGEFAHSRVSQDHIDDCVSIATIMLDQRPLAQWLEDCGETQKTFQRNLTTRFQGHKETSTTYYDNATVPKGTPPVAQSSYISQAAQVPQASTARADSPEWTTYYDNAPVPKGTPPVAQTPYVPQATQMPQTSTALIESPDRDSRRPFSIPSQSAHSDPLGMSEGSVYSQQGSVYSQPTSLRSSKAEHALNSVILKSPGDANNLMKRCQEIMAKSDTNRKRWSSMPPRNNETLDEPRWSSMPPRTTETFEESGCVSGKSDVVPGIPPTRGAETDEAVGGALGSRSKSVGAAPKAMPDGHS